MYFQVLALPNTLKAIALYPYLIYSLTLSSPNPLEAVTLLLCHTWHYVFSSISLAKHSKRYCSITILDIIYHLTLTSPNTIEFALSLLSHTWHFEFSSIKERKMATIRTRYNQVSHMTSPDTLETVALLHNHT